MSTRVEDFDAAVEALFSPLHQAQTKEALEKSSQRRKLTIADMRHYMQRCGLQLQDNKSKNNDNNKDSFVPSTATVSEIPIIHITGTKGKGSTACFCESILRKHYGLTTGLFTSPHLVDIRERIRVNGRPVPRAVFGQAYWTLRKRLEASRGGNDDNDDLPVLPGYFRMLVLMAVYIFTQCQQPRIQVIILEVGMGGRYDATNIFDIHPGRTVVCGVTQLDLDHTRVLGNTLEQIAWEKGGIFQVQKGDAQHISPQPTDLPQNTEDKEEETATTASSRIFFCTGTNTPSVIQVLKRCAQIEGRGISRVELVPRRHAELGDNDDDEPVLGLAGSHQVANASLAIAMCRALMQQQQQDFGTHMTLLQAVKTASWPGRCQTITTRLQEKDVSRPGMVVRLDGSHTPISLKAGWHWFQRHCRPDSEKVLLFHCSHERDPIPLLQILVANRHITNNIPTTAKATTTTSGDTIVDNDDSPTPFFSAVYFCRPDFERPSRIKPPRMRQLLEEYQHLVVDSNAAAGSSDMHDCQTWQQTLGRLWNLLQGCDTTLPPKTIEEMPQRSPEKMSKVTTNLSIVDALADIQKQGQPHNRDAPSVEIFVAGSLYVVGSVLLALDWKEADAEVGLGVNLTAGHSVA